uniref:HIG1 domain-containing protein n=1 Tax=Globisporangium ultimum (strain ATCC 200006 / CBS 805.95 / DAOM BR144) TaxID=431595 RepID=K3XB89_GLOUD
MSTSGAVSSAPTSTLEPHAARDIITWHAYTNGLKTGAKFGGAAAAAVLAANHYSPTFRKRLGISGKWALVVSSFLGSFTITSEKLMLAGTRNPQKYLDSIDPNYIEEKINERRTLKWYQNAANHVYDYPYRTLATVGVPLVGGIYAYQRTNKAIQASQQIMHTRIYGQGAVVVLLLSSMAFHDYMAKRGRFEPEE